MQHRRCSIDIFSDHYIVPVWKDLFSGGAAYGSAQLNGTYYDVLYPMIPGQEHPQSIGPELFSLGTREILQGRSK
jgi:hypothetical protein